MFLYCLYFSPTAFFTFESMSSSYMKGSCKGRLTQHLVDQEGKEHNEKGIKINVMKIMGTRRETIDLYL